MPLKELISNQAIHTPDYDHMPKDRAAMPARALARDGEKEGGVMMRTRVVVDPPSFRPRPWRVVSDQTSRGASIFLRRDHSHLQVALMKISLQINSGPR